MKRIILTSVLLLMGAAEESMAACVNDVPACYTQVTNLTSLLPGKTVCNGSSGNWNGQEWHSGSSGQAKNLIDYKHGPSSTNDPAAPIGHWAISGATVAYGYYQEPNNPGAGTVSSSYKVWQKADGTYDFCDSNTSTLVTNVTVQSGQGACIGSSTPIVCPPPIVSPSIVSPAPIESPAQKNDIQDEQAKPVVLPPKESDKRGNLGKPNAFPESTVLPIKENAKQDKPPVTPAKKGDKQDEPTVTPAKEGDNQDKPAVNSAKKGDKQDKPVKKQDKPTASPAKEDNKQGK